MKSSLRKVLNAGPPVPYSVGKGPLLTGINRGSRAADLSAMAENGTLFSIVDLLASAVGALEWDLYRKPPVDGRRLYSPGADTDQDRIQVVSHAALSLWRKPNPFMNTSMFVETCQQHFELTGEMVWLLDYGNVSFPVAMWPLRPDRVEPVPDPDAYIAGFVYTAPSGEKIPLETRQVIRTMRPNPMDPFHGLSAVRSLMADIGSAQASAQWNLNFFRNDATPGGIIEVPQSLGDADFKRAVRRWREQHQGVSNASRVAFLEQGKWVSTAVSQRDMMFTDLRNLSRDVLREGWRVHKTLLGDSDDVNLANATVAETQFARGETTPRGRRWRGALNDMLLPLFGTTGMGVEFDFCDPVPENAELANATLTAQTTAYSVLVAAGVDPDAASDTCGLPRMKVKPKAVAPVPDPTPADLPADSGFSDQEIANLINSFKEVMDR